MAETQQWHKRIGFQRDWVWRGWQTRYTYIHAAQAEQSSTPLILLHGFGASIEHWRHNLPALGNRHTVYALDLLGFGASRKAAVRYDVHLWVSQVYEFWRTFIGQPVVLIGNSIGSLVALVAAHTHPDMVKGLIMLSLPDVSVRQATIPKSLRPLVGNLEKAFASPLILKTLFKIVRHPAVIRRWVRLAYVNHQVVTEELVEILTAPAQDEGADEAFCALFQGMLHPQFSPPVKSILPKLSVPMLLIWGRGDNMIPLRLAHHLICLNPQIDLIELDAGHCPHDECPEELNTIVLSWLENYLVPVLTPVTSSQG